MTEMMAKVSKEAWVLIGSGIGVVLAAVLLAVMGSLREALLRMVPKLLNKLRRYPDKKDAEQNQLIYTSLVELRAKVNADRAYIVRFHNGNEFLPDNPVWKISCTHETVRSGVTYESAQLQGVLISRVHELVDAVITDGVVRRGVMLADCSVCMSRQRCKKENKQITIIEVDKMEDSYGKFILLNRNAKMVVQAGVVNGGKVFGIISVDFCEHVLEGVVLKNTLDQVCRFAERIRYYLLFTEVPNLMVPR